MRIVRGTGGSARAVLIAALAVLSVALVGCSRTDSNFEGVWKLEPAQAAFKPADLAQIPFTAAGRKAFEQNKAAAEKGSYTFDPTQMRCSSPGVPRLMLTPMLMKIYQRPHLVAILFEWNRLLREIIMEGGPQLRNPMQEGIATGGGDVGTAMGTTKGHWEGKTLVAHSTKFTEQKLLDAFIPNSEDLELTEHLRLKDSDTLEDRITIVDPQYFTQPWDTVLTYKRQADNLYPFHEDICLDRKKAGAPPLPR
jgi:hypothetical protein